MTTRNLGETTVTPSVLDRLIDRQPENRVETALSRPESIRQFRNAVRRDLGWLLNTRAILDVQDQNEERLKNEESEEKLRKKKLRESVYGYGLPDLSSFNMANAGDRNRLIAEVTLTIKRFEKRLRNVQLTIVPRPGQAKKDVHLRIDAVLRMDPVLEPVCFDSVIELKSGVCRLEDGPNAR